MKDLKYKKFVRLGHKFLWSQVTFFLETREDIYICEKCNYKILIFDNNLDYLSDLNSFDFSQLKLYCNEYIIKSIIE